MRPLYLAVWLQQAWPLVKDHVVDKIEAVVEEGTVKLYWAGTIIRIDIKPN